MQGSHKKLTKCRIDFVHHIKRRWLVVVESKYEGQRRECFLATAQIRDIFPALFGRSDAENDSLQHFKVET